jgi:hypothetical protein
MDEPERERAYARVQQWFAEHHDKITHHTHLMPPDSATTVRLDQGEPLITDGPFVRARKSSAASPKSTSRTWTRRYDWPGPGPPARSWRSDPSRHDPTDTRRTGRRGPRPRRPARRRPRAAPRGLLRGRRPRPGAIGAALTQPVALAR